MTLFSDDRTGALFSPDRVYRYRLWRAWDLEKPRLVCLMLNPSTADETQPDATITRCMQRAKRMGFGGLEVLNIFALRSTDPRALYSHPDPVGPENNRHILVVCEVALERGGQIMLGWGTHGALKGRGQEVRNMLDVRQLDTYALHINADGSPKHPLYVAMDKELIHVSPWAETEKGLTV